MDSMQAPIGADPRGGRQARGRAAFDKIYQTRLDCNVIAVRNQELSIDEYPAHSPRFGLVLPHPTESTRHPYYPEITMPGTQTFSCRRREFERSANVDLRFPAA